MGTIAAHEFITLDGVIEAPSWTFDYPFDPEIGEAIARVMLPSKAILLGRRTSEEFFPRGRPGPPAKTPARRS